VLHGIELAGRPAAQAAHHSAIERQSLHDEEAPMPASRMLQRNQSTALLAAQ
jgi:hypothetical protein